MSLRRSLSVIVMAAALLVVVWRFLPAASPPLYDGLCLADPYRLLGSSQAPASASKPYPAGTSFATSEVVTTENPPQAQLLMTDGTFVSPQAAFTVSVTPTQPPAARPATGVIDGNVYRLAATTSAGAALTPDQPITVVLRGTSPSASTGTIERLDGPTWTPLKTFSVGCGDALEAVTNRMGDLAVVTTAGSTSPPSPAGGAPVGLIVGLLIVVLTVVVLGLVRINRRRLN